MNKLLAALGVAWTIAVAHPVIAAEPPAEQLRLKDGSTLFLHPDGTSRMVDPHGKPMAMADGVEMELEDGRIILMKNRKVWVHYGPPGKGTSVLRDD